VLGGTVLFVLEPWLSRRSVGAHENRGLATALWPLAAAVVFDVALYGGYFGAGIGILMISALSLLRRGDVHRVVPFKNLLTGCLRGVAVVVLVIYGEIHWGYGVPMAAGGLIGGYLGGALTGRIDRTVLRAIVMIIGFGLAAYYVWTVYGPAWLHFGGEKARPPFQEAHYPLELHCTRRIKPSRTEVS